MQYKSIHPSGFALGICASILHTNLGSWLITITYRDSHHFNQTDMPFTISQCFDRQPNMVESRIDPYLAHKVNMELCHAYLRRHLVKGINTPLKTTIKIS